MPRFGTCQKDTASLGNKQQQKLLELTSGTITAMFSCVQYSHTGFKGGISLSTSTRQEGSSAGSRSGWKVNSGVASRVGAAPVGAAALTD